MTSAELVLQRAAEDGSLDPADWPKTLQYILDRLDEIINEFPRPPLTSDPSSASHTPSGQQTAVSSQESQSGDKENAAPSTPPRPPVPSFGSAAPAGSPNLPPETRTFYSSIRHTLSTNFPKDAPHTIQRLAELILEPRRRYKFLPAYLRALDRVVSVSSPNSIFPLPLAVLPTASALLNGATATPPPSSTLGSDESLGGALLTPIPWLQNRGQNELISESTEMVDGPNGAGRIETVSVGMLNGSSTTSATTTQQTPSTSPSSAAAGGGAVAQIASSHPDGETLPSTGPVTQGEILRQEQEAGIVLNNPHSLTAHPSRTTVGEMEGGATIVETVEGEEEVPHARGPEMIGLEDTGPQRKVGAGLDIEGAVGRPSLEGRGRSPQPAKVDEEMREGEPEKAQLEIEDEATSNQEEEEKDKEKQKQEPMQTDD